MISDEADVRILLKDELRKLKQNEITVDCDRWDGELGFASGSTREQIREAARSCGYEVIEEGSKMVELRKKPVGTMTLRRG